MQINIKRLSVPRKDDTLIILIADGKKIQGEYLSKAEAAYAEKERKSERKTVLINQYDRLVYIHFLTVNDKLPHQQLEATRKTGSLVAARIAALKTEQVTVVSEADPVSILAFVEGMALSSYQFLKYRNNKVKEDNKLKQINIVASTVSNDDIRLLNIIADATFRARDLVNEPQSFLTAVELAKQFQRMGKEAGFKVTVLDKNKIKTLKMGGLLAVNQGSIEPPTFTVMEYAPRLAKNKKPIVLIGKGVVYDTGGMSLKPTPNSMDMMKCDMAGGAVVGAVLYAIAKAGLPLHVIGLVPATDNRPDGNAYVPGDVITMMSGKTVEVLNTDAEGRLILADALHYAKRYKPQNVFEFSTLTGAAAAAIGQYGIVCMGQVDADTRMLLHESGNDVFERLAEFPFWEEFDDLLKSDIADMKNIGGPVAGAITAGRFLSQFIDFPYMHFDIAGPAFIKSSDSYRGKNGTGTGVRLMFSYMNKIATKK